MLLIGTSRVHRVLLILNDPRLGELSFAKCPRQVKLAEGKLEPGQFSDIGRFRLYVGHLVWPLVESRFGLLLGASLGPHT